MTKAEADRLEALALAVGQLSIKLDGVHGDVLETKDQAKETNGRVTELERWKIAHDAADAERRRLTAEIAKRAEKKERRLSSVVAKVGLVLTALLAVAAIATAVAELAIALHH